jgi:hypothetical protein
LAVEIKKDKKVILFTERVPGSGGSPGPHRSAVGEQRAVGSQQRGQARRLAHSRHHVPRRQQQQHPAQVIGISPSVADPGLLSRILIFTHSGSRIQKQQQKRGVQKICCQTFFCSHKFHKIKIFIF